MRVLGVIAALLSVSLGMKAAAADLPTESLPVLAPVAQTFSWSGFYLGLNAGAGFLDDPETEFTYVDGPGGFTILCTVPREPTPCPSSLDRVEDDVFFAGGVHAGANLQRGIFVFGAEADVSFLSLDDDGDTFTLPTVVGACPNCDVDVFRSSGLDNDWLATFRGRLGVAFNRVLIYGTGGLAVAHADDNTAFVGIGFPGVGGDTPPYIYAFDDRNEDDDDLEFGFAAGGGFEIAATDHFILGAEAIYFKVGDEDKDTLTFNQALSLNDPPAPGTFVTVHNSALEGVIARVRASYKFF